MLVPFGIMLGLTAAYALFWTVCVQRVNPFKLLVVEEVVERAINNYENRPAGDDARCPPSRFETPLMNAVQRDLAGWPSELSERSALLRLNDATAVIFSVRQKRLFMASIHAASLSSRAGDPARAR